MAQNRDVYNTHIIARMWTIIVYYPIIVENEETVFGGFCTSLKLVSYPNVLSAVICIFKVLKICCEHQCQDFSIVWRALFNCIAVQVEWQFWVKWSSCTDTLRNSWCLIINGNYCYFPFYHCYNNNICTLLKLSQRAQMHSPNPTPNHCSGQLCYAFSSVHKCIICLFCVWILYYCF